MILKRRAAKRGVEVRALQADEVPRAWLGFFDDSKLVIALRPSLTPRDQASILLHEVIHMVWHRERMPKRLTEEGACTRLGPALAQVFADNPHLLAAIAGALYHAIPIVKGSHDANPE